jgi:ATP-dependent exoDNAse (exonuclease V) alpha subunit
VLRYSRGSKTEGIAPGDYGLVVAIDPKENRITIERENGSLQTYDPRRLSGVSIHREAEREFSKGDRVQFTAPSRELQVANRDLGTVEQINPNGDFRIRIDSGREVRFNIREHPHIDHGYAVTSHSSQGQTAERVLLHVDTEKSELLVNNRFAYVSVSRAQRVAHIYTDNGSKLSGSLSREIAQRTAIEVEQQPPMVPKTEPVSVRGVRPSEEEQGRSLGIGLARVR